MQSSGLDPPLDFDFGVQRPKKTKTKKIVAADGSGDGRESKEELLFGLIFFCLTYMRCQFPTTAADKELGRLMSRWMQPRGNLYTRHCTSVPIPNSS